MTPAEPTPVDSPPDRTRRRRWSILAIVVVAGLVVAGAAGVGLWEVSSSPMLCNSCHIMKPYVAAWRTSKHNKVACVQCHYPPGLRDTIWVKYQALSQVVKWATQTYSSKPFAEIEDATGYRLTVNGSLHISAFPTLKLVAEDVGEAGSKTEVLALGSPPARLHSMKSSIKRKSQFP